VICGRRNSAQQEIRASDGRWAARPEDPGRAFGQDFVDCSAISENAKFENQTLLQIAQRWRSLTVSPTVRACH
jgi:prophage tail gpP-like protein